MKQRIITGVILGIVALLAILCLPTILFSLVIFLVALIGLYECSNLLKLEGAQRLLYLGVGGFTLFMVTLVMLLGAKGVASLGDLGLLIFVRKSYLLWGLLSIMALFWLFMPFVLSIHARRPIAFLTNPLFLFVASIFTLAALIVTVITLQQVVVLLLYLIVLVIVADSGAYFVGRKFGQRKLAPTISPGKSVEGAIGGILLGILFSLLFVVSMSAGDNGLLSSSNRIVTILNFVSLSALVVIVSISGDLFESVVKRHAGMKDSGTILPGHGGVLDRIDALTAAAPLFLVGLSFV